MTGVQRFGDGQVDHGVTEEFEAFVVAGRGVTVFVMPAGVDQCLLEQVEVADREADPSRERLGGTHDPVGPADARAVG